MTSVVMTTSHSGSDNHLSSSSDADAGMNDVLKMPSIVLINSWMDSTCVIKHTY